MTTFPQQIQSCGLNDPENCYSSISSVKKTAFTIVFLNGELAIYNVLVISPFYSQLLTTESVLYIVFSPFLLFFVMYLAVHSYQCFTISQIKLSIYNEGQWMLNFWNKNYLENLMCMLWRKELNISKFTIFQNTKIIHLRYKPYKLMIFKTLRPDFLILGAIIGRF